MAHYYGKISAPFGRKCPTDRLVDKTIYAKPWMTIFYEENALMYASEKIDGTNVGIKWDGDRVSFVGHTDKSTFCPRYLAYLNERFGTPQFESVLEEVFGEQSAFIFGEGVSKDYSHHYGYPDGEFIMYDICCDGKFWNRDPVHNVSKKFGMMCPHEELMPFMDAIEFVQSRPYSWLDPTHRMEGLVLRPRVELFTNNGDRVICKVKVRDFVDVKDYRQ